MLKKIGYGVVLWVIPYVTAIPLLPLMRSDLLFFKAIMVVEGLIIGAILAVLYFLRVQKDFLREGIVLGMTWMILNWILDYVALLPFTKMSLARYFMEIGIEYIGMISLTVAIGYVLHSKFSDYKEPR